MTDELMETWTGTDHALAFNDVLYGYDAQGRLASVTQAVFNGQTQTAIGGEIRYGADGNVISDSPPTTVYSCDAAGNLIGVADPNGTDTTYGYDDLNRLTDELVTNTITSAPVFAEHIDLDANGDGQRADVIDTRYNADGSIFSTNGLKGT